MPKRPTTIRLDASLYTEALHASKKTGISFSDVVHLLLQAFVQGAVHIGVSQYPEGYVRSLEKESAELSRLYRKGKVKGYTTGKRLFDDMLGR